MPDEPKTDPKAKAQQALAAPGLSPLFFAEEPREDRRRIRTALTTAIVVHLLFFAVSFPEAASEPLPAAEPQKVYVVEQHRFKRPEPKPEVIPERRARQVPIPDPTPDQPEPIREVAVLEEPQLELPATDALFQLPEAPPPPPEPVIDEPIAITGEVVRPVKISGADPVYSEAARRARIQGAVIVQATITREGKVTDVQLLKGLPLGLGEATVQAVRGWKYKPATLRGKPVPVYFNLTVHFGINN